MKETQRKYYLKELNACQTTFWQDINDLGNKIREEVIIPACKQHNLEFTSGNGTFFFSTQTGTYIGESGEIQSDRLKRVLTPLFDLLNTEVTHNQCLGYFVSDVRKEDLK